MIGTLNCVYERQHPARGDFIDEFFNVMATETRVVRAS